MPGGSNSHGPIICTRSSQSGCGYSKGCALVTRTSGARLIRSVLVASGFAPSRLQMRLSGSSIAPSIDLAMTGRSASSRSRPSRPGHGRRPGPNGGTVRDARIGGYGQKDSQGIDAASATAGAPQQLASMIDPSGRTESIVARMSSASRTARSPKASNAVRTAARGFGASQSVIATASIRGSTAEHSSPNSPPSPTASDMVRRTIRWPRALSSTSSPSSGYRLP